MILILASIDPRLRAPGLGRSSAVTEADPASAAQSGAGGWLESACKLIVTFRAGILLVTLSRCAAGRRPQLPARARSSSPASPRSSRCATGTASARRSSATRPTWRPSSCSPTLILRADRRREPVLLLHARHRAARRPALRLAGRARCSRRCWSASTTGSISVRAGRRRVPRHLPDRSRPAGAVPARRGRRRGRARPARPPGRGGGASSPPGAPDGRRGRARAARARHARLAGQDRLRHRLRARSRWRARSSATRQGAADEARRLAEDARQATREAREIIIGPARRRRRRPLPLPTALQAEARALGGRAAASRLELAIEDVGRARPGRRARARVDPARGAGNVDAPRAARARSRAAAAARRPRGADDRRRRRAASRCPTTLEELARGRHFGVTGMRERAQLAGGDLSVESAPGEGCVLSVWVPAPEARRDAPERRPRRAAAAPPPAPSRPIRVPRAVPGYTWQ